MVEFYQTVLFIIILFSVPLQFYLSPTSVSDTNYYLSRFLNHFKEIAIYYFGDTENIQTDNFYKNPLKIADEVVPDLSIEKNSQFFGGSDDPRDPRSPVVKFYVGQVVRHKIHKYRGVIIAWDETASAPSWWLEKVHKNRVDWNNMPNYAIAIDTRNRLIPQVAYVVEENILLDSNAVRNPLVKHYFEGLKPDGKSYKLRPWHQKTFPND